MEISRETIQKKDSELAASRAELDTLTHTKETMEKDLTLRITQLKDQSEHLTLHITQLVQAQN